MMNLNCVNARARIQAESELEAASKKVESAFIRMQVKEVKTDAVALAIREAQETKASEMQAHIAWLQEQKRRLEQELRDVDKKLEEKKLLLQERTALTQS